MAPVASTCRATSCVLLVMLLQSILLSLLSQPAAADREQVMLDTGSLKVGESLYNLPRNYMLIMEGDCNLAFFAGSKRLWQTGTSGSGTDCQCEFQRIGATRQQLVVVSPFQNKVIWQQPNVIMPYREYVLVLQPDRNVVIYRKPVWATQTRLPKVNHVTGDQVLISGDRLGAGQYLINAQHNYKFVNEDCNLVLYDGTEAIWESGTNKGSDTRCHAFLNDAGNLVIQDDSGNQVWKSNNRLLGHNYALVLRPDRDVVAYTEPVWNTNTYINETAANSSSGYEEDGGLIGGRKTMIHMVTNEAA